MLVPTAKGVLLSVGADLAEVDRIGALRRKYGDRFLHWVYTPEEITHCLEHACPDLRFATRFAAKEAVAKAFQVGIGKELHWKWVSIAKSSAGAPRVLLDTKANALLERFGAREVLVSLSHTHTIGFAVATLIGDVS